MMYPDFVGLHAALPGVGDVFLFFSYSQRKISPSSLEEKQTTTWTKTKKKLNFQHRKWHLKKAPTGTGFLDRF